jgi:hypothetical protein
MLRIRRLGMSDKDLDNLIEFTLGYEILSENQKQEKP